MHKMRNIRRVFIALVLVLSLTAALPGLHRSVKAVDFSQDMTLTIFAGGGSDFEEDIAKADVVLDLYMIATAQPDPSYDSFDLTVLAPYDEAVTIDKETDKDGWKETAQKAAAIALEKGTVTATVPVGQTTEALTPGLYLVIARGENLTEYVGSVTDPSLNDNIVTIANSNEYEYIFTPELVTLPTKNDVNEDGSIMTSVEDGEWIYNYEGNMKPTRNLRFGSLEIIKDLKTYETTEEATFVFNAVGVNDAGEKVYDEVAGITFSGAGNQSVQLDMIPVGAKVTVTEIYSGSTYELTAQPRGEVTIKAEEIAQVTFENDYTPDNRHGHGIVNTFTYDQEEGWSWNGNTPELQPR